MFPIIREIILEAELNGYDKVYVKVHPLWVNEMEKALDLTLYCMIPCEDTSEINTQRGDYYDFSLRMSDPYFIIQKR